jgi:rSAM/selenodomain-associated transferase 1
LNTVAEAGVGATELWCTAPTLQMSIDARESRPPVNVRLQPEADLGARMAHALRDGLERAQTVILIGTDCPAMLADDLRAAAAALASGCDAVLGPAEDGGFWLIGASRYDEALLAGIAWSSATVLESQRERLRSLDWHWRELRTLWDIDRPEDFDRLLADPLLSPLAVHVAGGVAAQ